MWRRGSKLVHPYNPELGVGVVREMEDRFLLVYFPEVERELTLSANDAGLRRLILDPGSEALLVSTNDSVTIAEVVEHGYVLSDGRRVADAEVWPATEVDSPLERLANLRLDSPQSFRNRIAGLELRELREAGGLGSFLGGRIELFPHQLHAALRAVERDPVRWLLADEVGLGKTVEACLILSALLRTGRAQRALVLAPSTLTVQWLGELYRKFHQVFVLLDQDRADSVASDYGEGANPFDVHPFAVASLEWVASDPHLLELALQAEPDAVVIDEAHRLVRSEFADALAPLVERARHALLLTATPLQADGEGFYRLLEQLHPGLFENFEAFRAAVEAGEAQVPCATAIRRSDVGGLPPRAAQRVGVQRFEAAVGDDPRARWLAAQAKQWKKRGEKALVFVRGLATLEELASHLESQTQTRVTVFHEELSPAKRDIEIASFRESAVPILLCTEAGGEGRNFQFCDRMVHYELPPDPVELEQRIGRLDRIGRDTPVEILYFVAQQGDLGLADLYERLDLFERPAAGLDAALGLLRPAIEAAERDAVPLDVDALAAAVEAARAEHPADWAQVFYPDAYTPERGPEILARVPDDLEEKTRAYCLEAARDLGFEVIEKGGEALYYIEFGAEAKVDALPGLAGGSRFLGTFHRAEAVEKEEADFFASGHPLVEGLLLELEDGSRGRAALCELTGTSAPAPGLLGLYKDGAAWQAVAVDAEGTLQPSWVPALLAGLPNAKRGNPTDWGLGPGWAQGIRALGERLEGPGKLEAVLFFRPGERLG